MKYAESQSQHQNVPAPVESQLMQCGEVVLLQRAQLVVVLVKYPAMQVEQVRELMYSQIEHWLIVLEHKEHV